MNLLTLIVALLLLQVSISTCNGKPLTNQKQHALDDGYFSNKVEDDGDKGYGSDGTIVHRLFQHMHNKKDKESSEEKRGGNMLMPDSGFGLRSYGTNSRPFPDSGYQV